MTMTEVLVTGAAGQDGRYLVERLVEQGRSVHAVVRPGEDVDTPWDDRVTVSPIDITAASGLSDLILDVRPQVVVNLAAISSVHTSWSLPAETLEVNAVALARILAAAWELHTDDHTVRVVQASSAEIFGQASESPQRETTPLAPVSPYGVSKATAHQLIGLYRARGLFASTAILYNHESPLRPEAFVTRKITAAVARIAAGRQDLLELGNLDAERDWGWAPDYARALDLIAQAPEPDDFVVATGTTHSIRDFVAAAFGRVEIHDWEALVRVNPAFVRPADPARQVGDATRIRARLGWVPSVSFEELVHAMVDHDVALLADER